VGANIIGGTPVSVNTSTIRREHTSVLYDGKFYIWGGRDGSGYLNTMMYYDFATGSFQTVSQTSPPTARIFMCSWLYNGYWYIFGGYDGTNYLNDMYRFDFSTSTWASVSMSGTPPAIRSAAAAVNLEGTLYLHGGVNSTTCFQDFFSYNLATDTWTTLTSSGYVGWGSAMFAVGGGLYVIAGSTATAYGTVGATNRFYDLSAASWTTKTAKPTAMNVGNYAVLDNKCYMLGGNTTNSTTFTKAIEVYDPLVDRWTPLVDMTINGYRGGTNSAVACNGSIWTYGGENASGGMTNLYRYS